VRGHQHGQTSKKGKKRKTNIELSLERASCRADRSPGLQRSRIEILPTHAAWRPASPSSKGSNPPETISLVASSSRMLRAALTSRFQRLVLSALLAPRRAFLFFRNSKSPSSLVASRRAFSSVSWHSEHSLLVLSDLQLELARVETIPRNVQYKLEDNTGGCWGGTPQQGEHAPCRMASSWEVQVCGDTCCSPNSLH